MLLTNTSKKGKNRVSAQSVIQISALSQLGSILTTRKARVSMALTVLMCPRSKTTALELYQTAKKSQSRIRNFDSGIVAMHINSNPNQ